MEYRGREEKAREGKEGRGPAQSNKGRTGPERQGQLDCHSGLFGALHFAFQLATRSSRTRGLFLACPSRRRHTFILWGVSDSQAHSRCQPALQVL